MSAALASRSRAFNGKLVVGLVILGLLILAAAMSFFWTPSPDPLRMRITSRLLAPSPDAFLGTDQLGRDVLSLVMIGARNSLFVAGIAVLTGAVLGISIGLVAAERKGWTETLLMRGMDALFAFPPVLSAMMLSAAIGPGPLSVIVAIAVFTMPVFARVSRASALQILARDFVLAARALGKGGVGVMRQHVLPNITGDLAVQLSIQLGLAIITEAGLSFLGLGLRPPAPSWGRMLADSQTFLSSAPWLAVAPGLAIALAVLGFNLVGDGLRDRFDPRRTR